MANNTDLSPDFLVDLFKCVSAEALKKENIEKYDLKIYGSEDKIEQYGSDIAFIDITAENFDGEKREYNLVLKYGHTQKNVTKKVPIREGFNREIDIYTKLVPCFNRFLEQKNQPLLHTIPKCFLTKYSATDEIIVLENLKKSNYVIYDRKRPMNLDHIRLILKIYAKWHALSLAMDVQYDKKYLEIKKGFLMNPWNLNSHIGEMINHSQTVLYSILEQSGETRLLRKYQQKLGNADYATVLMDLISGRDNIGVILHGDCWNNNFLFKYKDSTEKSPIDAAMLDFQLTSFHSPVLDLSHFIYAVASSKELKHVKKLLDHYYFYLAMYLKKLDTSPEKVFPFRTLKLHWRKFSTYGAILNPFIAMYCFVDKENTADFGVCQTLKNATTKPEYMRRVVGVAKHFIEFEL